MSRLIHRIGDSQTRRKQLNLDETVLRISARNSGAPMAAPIASNVRTDRARIVMKGYTKGRRESLARAREIERPRAAKAAPLFGTLDNRRRAPGTTHISPPKRPGPRILLSSSGARGVSASGYEIKPRESICYSPSS